MQYFGNTLAVEASWLINAGVISLDNYRQMVVRGNITRLNRAARNTPALVAYDSLPEPIKNKVQKFVPDPYKAAGTNMIEDLIEHSPTASNFFDEYKLSNGRFLPAPKRREYYADAIVLNAISKFIGMKNQKRKSLGKSAIRSWEQIANYVQDMDRSKYPHELPANPRYLETKYKQYKNEGYECLISKKFMNKNAAKMNDKAAQSYLGEILSNQNNLDNVQACNEYNRVARLMDWKEITPDAVADYRKKWQVKTYPGRRGMTAFMNNKAMQVKRSAPSYPLYFWTLDGWEVELMYQRWEEGKNGKSGHTTYHNRPTVVVVLDACTKYIVGYATGTHECAALIQAALRNAEKHVEQLFGQMYRTQQIQSDRYALSAMQPYYEGIAKHVTPTKAKNAKAKIIEPFFNTINRKYCQLMQNWSGFGITSNKDKQANADYINEHKKAFPDFNGVCKQIDAMVQRDREEKVARYTELWEQMPVEHKIELSHENYLLLFGEKKKDQNTLQGNGLRVTIKGQRRDYDCFDLSFRDHSSQKWEIRYDPDNLEKVLAVNEDETLRYVLEEKYVQPMALIERKEGDKAQLDRVNEYNKSLIKSIVDWREDNWNNLHGLPAIEDTQESDTLRKLLITDSRGQHKDRRNERNSRHKLSAIADAEVVKEINETDFYNLY
jgi:hypothetical protein